MLGGVAGGENLLPKMKTICSYVKESILPVLLLAAFIPAACAQTIFQVSPTRDTYNSLASGDSTYGPYFNSYSGAYTNDVGAFYASDTSVTPAGQHFVSAQSSCLQDSLITASATSLSVTGVVQMTASGGASFLDGIPAGEASWYGYSRVSVSFSIDKPFSYSLQASTLFVTNLTELAPTAYMVLTRAGYPDVAAFGNSRQSGYTPGPPSGTSSGILPAGLYGFRAEAIDSSGVDPFHSPTAENYFVSFTLTVTYVPQPPGNVALTPKGAGTFLLIWNAPQAGNYRVMSSTNLTDWTEYIPVASRPSGPNTNTVNVIPGSSRGYFLIQYLP
jgi:hypothetical protein